MAIPDFQSLMLPLLKLAGDGKEHTFSDSVEELSREFQLSDDDRAITLRSGQTRMYNRVGWAKTYLTKAKLLRIIGLGQFQLTERGRELLASGPTTINVSFLESRYPEMSDFRKARSKDESSSETVPATFNTAEGTWGYRSLVEERIRRMLERSIPNDVTRVAALRFLAMAIENADEERGDAWYLRDSEHGLRLMTGRVLACEVSRSKIRVSVIGPISDDVRGTLGAEAENDWEFKLVPGGLLLTFPVEHAAEGIDLLSDGLNSFIDVAMARVRSSVSLEDHVPEGVVYIGGVLGRDLPQPVAQSPDSEQRPDVSEADDFGESRVPRLRGRSPIFELGQRSIASLMEDIKHDVIALPDLQRPFVWEDTKVRQLLDSLFVGFPVGTLVFWHTSIDKDARALGADRPGLRATTLVIDGQQRLTSLYAVIRGVEVIGKDGDKRKITIAFRPRDGRFEVADAAIRNDPEFLPNVTELWVEGRLTSQIRRELIDNLRDKGHAVDADYEDTVESNLGRAHAINEYRLPTVDIRKTATSKGEEVTEEDVAEIFVRINNQGTRLGQADFVLTLLSVYHGKLRDRIEDRAREMSEGPVIGIDTQQLLRAVCGVAFGRARMSAIYRYLRGVDPTTGEADTAGRLNRLRQMDAAATECLEPTPWRDYILRVKHAGFISQALVASKNAVVNAYTFYIRGRKVGVPKGKLDELISRWVFASLLTARYSASSETIFEEDLARVVRLGIDDSDGFVRALDDAISETITGDYWTHTLVSALETQKARAPAALAFRAAQVVLGTRALFSDQTIQNLLDPSARATRSPSEVHHVFPVAWLQKRGIHERRVVNQVANLAVLGWHEHSLIGAKGPAEYVPQLRQVLSIDDDRWGRLCAEHALPLGWESMEYSEFLRERRSRMADVIRVAYRQLGGESDVVQLTPPWFLQGAETVWKRIAETERALRGVVRNVYSTRYGESAFAKIQAALPERDRETLLRALRARPADSEPLSVVDYLYLGQLPLLLFSSEVWPHARNRFVGAADTKQRLQTAINQIAPIRNEIAHVREVAPDRLLRATVACADVLEMLQPIPPP